MFIKWLQSDFGNISEHYANTNTRFGLLASLHFFKDTDQAVVL